MNADEVLLIGVKRSVAAISRREGQILWSTKLPGGMGTDFVTVACDGRRVFAHSDGKLHCLDLDSGRVLWSNGLPGYGYGLATLCIPGQSPAPDSPLAQAHASAQQHSSHHSHRR